MMKTKNLMNKAVFLFLFFGCFFAYGCASTIPISDGILQEIGGIDNANQFQYYVSKTITLTLVDTQSSVNVEDGQLRRTSSSARESVIIQANLPGLVRGQGTNTNSTLNPTLLVAFEEFEGIFPTLSFGKYRVGSEEKYYLLYRDPDNKIVQYGNTLYKVSFGNTEEGQPYLLIRSSQSENNTSKSRVASGLRL